ncbi:hypothetical protein CKAH01_09938 [Colletotrichum kahawae]|uniref:Uncharacterized protein n=1 Tax=Colletotrichum kahawae TaxID=34407 RepID=A0AAE0CY13_COLKA|nr:hypothetical protein CKAH01_09938 [Colletotrichum kahawae]
MKYSTSLDSSDRPPILCPPLVLHAEYIQSLKSAQIFAASCGELGRHPTHVYPRFSMYSRRTPCLRRARPILAPTDNHSTGPKACLASPCIVLRRRLFLGPASQSARLLFSSTRCIQSLLHPSHIRRSRSPAYYKACLRRALMSRCRLMTRPTCCLRGDGSHQALGTRTRRRPCEPSASYQLRSTPVPSRFGPTSPVILPHAPILDRTTLQLAQVMPGPQGRYPYCSPYLYTPPDPVIWHPTPPAHPSFSPTSLH